MWIVSKTEAVEMYARSWSARYGSTASKSARKMADSLASKGDREGHGIWNEVANVIERQQQEKRRAGRQEMVMTPS